MEYEREEEQQQEQKRASRHGTPARIIAQTHHTVVRSRVLTGPGGERSLFAQRSLGVAFGPEITPSNLIRVTPA